MTIIGETDKKIYLRVWIFHFAYQNNWITAETPFNFTLCIYSKKRQKLHWQNAIFTFFSFPLSQWIKILWRLHLSKIFCVTQYWHIEGNQKEQARDPNTHTHKHTHTRFWPKKKKRNPIAITDPEMPGSRVINLTWTAPSSNSQSVYQILKMKWQVKIISQNI